MDTTQLSFGFMNAPQALLITQDRLITACNAQFATLFGYDAAELVGQRTAILYPSQREFVEIGKLGLRQMRAKGSHQDDRIMKRKDTELIWCRVKGSAQDQQHPYKLCVWSFEALLAVQSKINLTVRERQVALHLTKGLTTKEIAKTLGRSPRTVEIHRSSLLSKMGVRNVAELVAVLTRGL